MQSQLHPILLQTSVAFYLLLSSLVILITDFMVASMSSHGRALLQFAHGIYKEIFMTQTFLSEPQNNYFAAMFLFH